MRRLIAAVALLCFTVSCIAQTTAPIDASAPPGWQKVEALIPGTDIFVNNGKKTLRCAFKSATGDSITCIHKVDVVTFRMQDVHSIKHGHKHLSLGLGIYPGLAPGMFLVSEGANVASGGYLFEKNSPAPRPGLGGTLVVIGVALMIAVPIIAYKTCFIRTMVYRAPSN